MTMYGVAVFYNGYWSLCSFDGTDDYQFTTSKSKAEQFLDRMVEWHPKETYRLITATAEE